MESSASLSIPPTRPGTLPARPASWPGALGSIGIVWSILNLLCGASSYFSVQIFEGFGALSSLGGAPDPEIEAQTQVAKDMFWLFIVTATIWEAAFVWMLIASIGLVRRRPWSPRACKAVAIVVIAVVLFDIAIQILMYQATAARLDQAGLGGNSVELTIGLVVSAGLTAAFCLSLPIFMLLWLRRPAVRSLTATWRAATPASV